MKRKRTYTGSCFLFFFFFSWIDCLAYNTKYIYCTNANNEIQLKKIIIPLKFLCKIKYGEKSTNFMEHRKRERTIFNMRKQLMWKKKRKKKTDPINSDVNLSTLEYSVFSLSQCMYHKWLCTHLERKRKIVCLFLPCGTVKLIRRRNSK